MAFTLMALWHALKALRRRDSVYRSGVGFGAAMGIIALLIHSSTDFNLQIPANAANTEGKINSSRRGRRSYKSYGAPTKKPKRRSTTPTPVGAAPRRDVGRGPST
jgi:hypothetical protein